MQLRLRLRVQGTVRAKCTMRPAALGGRSPGVERSAASGGLWGCRCRALPAGRQACVMMNCGLRTWPWRSASTDRSKLQQQGACQLRSCSGAAWLGSFIPGWQGQSSCRGHLGHPKVSDKDVCNAAQLLSDKFRVYILLNNNNVKKRRKTWACVTPVPSGMPTGGCSHGGSTASIPDDKSDHQGLPRNRMQGQ